MLDDEGQIAFMELLSDALPRATDNAFIRGEIINNILGGEFSEIESQIFEAIDLVDGVASAAAIANLGSVLVKTGKILNTARRMNEPTLAAEIIETAVKNPEAAAKVGVTQADISDAVNPLVHGETGN